MIFEVNNVRPLPIPEKSIAPNSIWNNGKARLESPKSYKILASSGKGKSTLVAYMYGLRNDYTGEVLLDGEEVRSISLHKWAEIRRTKLSVVFQDMRLFPSMTLGENLLIKNRLTNHKTEKEIREMVHEFGLEDKWQQMCGTLSLGQQQRVAIIRSLLQPFDFLLMDEPFSHLDHGNVEIGCRMIMREAEVNNGGYCFTTLGDPYLFAYQDTVTI